ncbi:MAG: hypothetical protein EXQ93_03890 [Alphaproteobacteria bacterium]|nr:hypothetical protein [Alphaproteobacteria bacterium]
MPLDAQQMTAADVLAVRIPLGQLIVRIAAGAQDPAAALKVMRDSSVQTASGARLRGLNDEQQEEVRKYVQGSIDRFYASMCIEKGKPPAAGAAPAASQPAQRPAPKAPPPAAKPQPAAAAAAKPQAPRPAAPPRRPPSRPNRRRSKPVALFLIRS